MNCFSGMGTPEDAYISVRSKLIEIEGEIDRPTRNRRKTDGNFIYVMAVFFVILAGMLIYCGATANGSGDHNRRRRYIDDFDNYKSIGDMQPVPTPGLHDLKPKDIAYMALITIALILTTLLLLRYFIGPFIWALLVVACVACIAITGGLWLGFASVMDDTHGLIVFPLIATVVTAVVIFLIYATRRRIQMIIQVFKEAGKAVGDMPQLFIQPAISFVSFMVSVAAFIFFTLVITRAGLHGGVYNPDDLVVCTYVFLYWGAVWLVYFYKGCQSMIIGSCVATWYFRRDKSNLGSPMWRATSNLVRYHLGTVAFGSFLMLLMEIIKAIADFFTKRKVMRVCCCCCACICCMLKKCIAHFERIIKYFTKMAYIMTSIHSVPFCTGGREAIHLLVQHAFSLLQLKCFCMFVLGILQLLIVAAVAGLAFAIFEPAYAPMMAIVSGAVAFFAANSFLSIYNIAIDTIFLCYCEDIAENDGVTKPYFMSRELMSFMNDCMRTLSSIVRDFIEDTAPKRDDDQPSAQALGPI